MISRHHFLPTGGARPVRCLTLALMAVIYSQVDAATAPARQMSRRPTASRSAESRALLPYLAAVGTPPLRFEENAPPPDLTTNPPAAAPPVPGGPPETIAVANRESAISLPAEVPPAPTSTPSETAPAPAKVPPSSPALILPDDTRREVRPEEVLPFFQYPGSPAQPDVTVAVPFTPSQPRGPALPPSSATYKQK